VPPRRRYWIRDLEEEGGVRRRMSAPWEERRKTPWEDEVEVFALKRCSR